MKKTSPKYDQYSFQLNEFWDSTADWYNEANVNGKNFKPVHEPAWSVRKCTPEKWIRGVLAISIFTGLVCYILWPTPESIPVKERPNPPSLYVSIRKFCDRNRLRIHEEDEVEGIINIDTSIYGKKVIVSIFIYEEDSTIMFHCPFPALLHKDDIAFLSVCLMEMNGEYIFGNFQMDTLNRLLFFRSTVNLRGTGINDSLFLAEFGYPMREIRDIVPFILKRDGISVADTNNDSEEEVS